MGREIPSESLSIGDVRVERAWYRHCCKLLVLSLMFLLNVRDLPWSVGWKYVAVIPRLAPVMKNEELLALTMQYIDPGCNCIHIE